MADEGQGGGWEAKSREGKMFVRVECERCGWQFNFSQRPRVTQTPRCPACGSFGAHAPAA